MKPTVMATSSANAGGGGGAASAATANGMNIPINHEYGTYPHAAHPQQQPAAGYGSPGAFARQQQQQQPPPQQQQHPQQQQQIPAHFQQGFGFEPDMDMDMDMFPRTRLGRMHHDPFAGFGGSHFGFPQFGSLGRRRPATDHMNEDSDFFTRLPSEFRQYIPENFGHRRAGSASMPSQQQQQQAPQMPPHPQAQYYQNYVPTGSTPPSAGVHMPQSPSKKVCDAAIQTEDPSGGRSEVDSAAPAMQHSDNLNQHGLRNTVDMGVKSAVENEQGPRSHSAPPNEQQQLPVNGKRPTPPPQQPQQQQYQQPQQFGTQTSPQTHAAGGQTHQQPQFQKAYYPPPQQTQPQQKQQTPPPPQTPGGTYVRTIPIFVEGRTEPIINSHKEIPNQYSSAPTAKPQQQQQQQPPQQQYYQQPTQQQPPQQHRPTPFNTQQQAHEQPPQQAAAAGLPPQTPHTLDSINKIQDIQRDVLDLMGRVEKFTGTRRDKSYGYLDEMLTRNLLKLDTIDTNGKDSIRLARKEAIKCIQASINVLEAKAEENAKTAQGADAASQQNTAEANAEAGASKSASKEEVTKEATTAEESKNAETAAAANSQEPIPLPAPVGMVGGEAQKSSSQTSANAAETARKEGSPSAGEAQNSGTSLDTMATESK